MSNDINFDVDYDDLEVRNSDSFNFDSSSHIQENKVVLNTPVDGMKEVKKADVDYASIHNAISSLLDPEVPTIEHHEKEESSEVQESQSDSSPTKEADGRSVYVGNVDYSTTVTELQSHFESCGKVNRITIGSHRGTGHPKGFAYIEFSDREAVMVACALNDTVFKGRNLKVLPKRTNVPGLGHRGRGSSVPRGRGFPRGRGGFRGSFRGGNVFKSRGRGRGSYNSHLSGY